MFTTMCPKEQQLSDNLTVKDHCFITEIFDEGPVKLMQKVEITHSFLQSVSNQFHVIILCLPMYFCTSLSKNFSKPTAENGEIGSFNRFLLIEPF